MQNAVRAGSNPTSRLLSLSNRAGRIEAIATGAAQPLVRCAKYHLIFPELALKSIATTPQGK